MDQYVAPSAIDQNWNPRPPRRWGKWVVIGSATILVAVGIAAGWSFIRNRDSDLKQVEQSLRDSLGTCESEANPEACRAKLVTGAATEGKVVAACDMLAGTAHDDCVWAVARETGDASSCQAMTDPERSATCADDVRLRVAVATDDPSTCGQISDARFKASCLEQIDPLTAANCTQRENDIATCEALSQRDAAVAAGDLSLCGKIAVVEIRNSCLDLTGETDVDADGLTALSEQDYGTSPSNPDTDGDSFKDGDEVAAGFNPAGPGSL